MLIDDPICDVEEPILIGIEEGNHAEVVTDRLPEVPEE
jgi:hypothetical protein